MAANKTVARTIYLKIDEKPVERSVSAITSEMRKLESEQRKLVIGSQEYVAKAQRIRELKGILSEHKRQIAAVSDQTKTASFSIKGLADGFNKYLGVLASSVASIAGITMTVRKCVQAYADMEEAEAQVMKYTGMTKEEVEDLNEDFKKIDTRTSREQLNALAGDAGRLGITSKEGIEEFVDAADKINVALGSDLGENAVKDIGKLAQMFGEDQRLGLRGAMLATGSAINELAQNSSASEPYLMEFTSRLSGVGNQAHMTQAQILGFGSVLDQNQQKMEASSTALQNLIAKMYQDPAKLAKAAGMDIQNFVNLVKTDANEALLALLDTLGKAGGMENLAPIFKDMGTDGSRAVATFSVLAQNIDKVRSEQVLANKAYEEGTSVINEFNVQNNTVQAQLDKAKKRFNDLSVELGRNLVPLVTKAISAGGTMIQILGEITTFVAKNKTAVTAAASAIAIFTTAQMLSNAQSKLMVFWNTKVMAGLRALFLLIKTNPWTAAITAVVLLIAHLKDLNDQMSETARRSKMIADVRAQAALSAQQEKDNVNALLKVAKDETRSKMERTAAIARLNEISPEYLGNLTLENINTRAADNAVKNYTASLIANAKAKAIAQKIEEIRQKKEEIKKNPGDSYRWYDPFQTGVNDLAHYAEKATNVFKYQSVDAWNKPTFIEKGGYARNTAYSTYIRQQKELNALVEDEKALKSELDKTVATTVQLDTKADKGGTSGGRTATGTATSGRKVTEQDKVNKQMEALELRHQKALNKIKTNYLESGQQTQADYMADVEALEMENLQEKLKIAELEPKQIEQINAQILDAKMKLKERLLKEKEDEAKSAKDNEEKAAQAEIDARKKVYERGQLELLRQYADGSITKLEYEKETADLENEYLQDVLNNSRITEEQRAKFEEEMANKRIAIAENEADAKKKSDEELFETAQSLATGIGETIAQFLTDSEMTFGDFLKNMLQQVLSTIEKLMIAYIAQTTMQNIATLGVWGLAKAAAEIALIVAAFETAKAAIGNFYTGGYTGGGEWDEPRGTVHAGEFVANRFAVSNPNVRGVLDVIDQAQRNNTVANLSAEDIAAASGNTTAGTANARAAAAVSTPGGIGMAVIASALSSVSESMAKLNKKLDEPIFTYTTATGKYGVNEAQRLIQKMKVNSKRGQ